MDASEQVHATNHYIVLGMFRGTADDLQVAINGETYEVNGMYPIYKAIAERQDERGAQRSIGWALAMRRKFTQACI